MRVCGTFCRFEQLLGAKKGPQADTEARETVRSALLAVDDAERRPALQTRCADRLDGLAGGTAGGDDVLDEANHLAPLEYAFETLRRAVRLRLLADDQERQARRERRRSGQRDGAELGACQAVGLGLELPHGDREALAESGQQFRACL